MTNFVAIIEGSLAIGIYDSYGLSSRSFHIIHSSQTYVNVSAMFASLCPSPPGTSLENTAHLPPPSVSGNPLLSPHT